MLNSEDQSNTPWVNYAEFSLGGLLRFLSHQELLDLLARAAIRAQLPLAFSHGFNPRPKLSLPVPRSVGMSCEKDLARFELTQPIADGELADRLGPQLPDELTIDRSWSTSVRQHPQPREVEWKIDLAGLNLGDLSRRVAEFLARPTWPIERKSIKAHRPIPVDLRRFVLDLRIDETTLRARLAAGPEGSIRPAELLAALELPAPQGLARISRTKIYWTNEAFLN